MHGKMCREERKGKIINEFFEMMLRILRLPFDKSMLQLNGFELIGDILSEFRDYNAALFYYLKGVIF